MSTPLASDLVSSPPSVHCPGLTTSTPSSSSAAEERNAKARHLGSMGKWATIAFALAALLLAYPLSLGPVAWWYGGLDLHAMDENRSGVALLYRSGGHTGYVYRTRQGPPPDALIAAYAPLISLYIATPAVHPLFQHYLRIWGYHAWIESGPSSTP